MKIDVSSGADVIIVCGETLPDAKLGSSSFWAANRLTLVRCSEEPLSVLSQCAKLQPSLLVARQGFIDGLSDKSIAAITGEGKRARILVILEKDSPDAMFGLLRRGCHGFLPSRFAASVLHRVVPAILGGEIWAPRRVISEMLSELLKSRNGRQKDGLTPREEHILELVVRGYKNSEIAAALFISSETVRWHKRRLHRKIGGANALATKLQTRRTPPTSESGSLKKASQELR